MSLKKLVSCILAAAVVICGQTFGTASEQADCSAAGKSRVSVHDPSIFKDKNGTYYVFGSHIDAAKSTDLQNWKVFTNGYATTNNTIFGNLSQNLSKPFAWAGENLQDCENGFAVWAPDVIYNPDYVNSNGTKGAYMMYFCTSSTAICSVIGFAVSQKPEGPYQFVDTLIYSGFTSNDTIVTSSTKRVNRKYTTTNIDELIAAGQVTYNNSWFSGTAFNSTLFPNAIDPTIYYDTKGNMYMCYGSWSGGIFTLQIDPKTGQCIHPKTGTTSDGRMVDSYFGTKISGGNRKSGEGPFIEYNSDTGYYYLWVTYGGLFSDGGYNMRVFRSKNPLGPFTDPAGNPAVLGNNSVLDNVGLKVMGNHKFSSLTQAYMACGHNSVLKDDDGKWYLFNHARFADGTEYHEVRVHSMYFNSEGWPVVAPYEYSGDVMSETGYEESEIAGDYEIINHGTDTGKSVHNYANIKLGEDGTITGFSKGMWSQSKDSSAASFVIDGKTYEGYFMAVQDETGTGKKVMAFTAVGTSNQTVWGVKTTQWGGKERKECTDYTSKDSSLVYNWEKLPDTGGGVKIAGTDLLSGVPYFIKNINSGLLMEVKNGKTDSGTNIQQWEMNKDPHHEWRICDTGDGWCSILLMSDESMAVTVDGKNADNGLNTQLEKYTGGDNQLFKLVKDGSRYGIVSKCSNGKGALDVFEWSLVNGGNINQWEYKGYECQLWKIEPVYPSVPEGSYKLKNVNSGKWLSVSGSDVVQDSKAAVWGIEKTADGSCTLKSKGMYLTVEGGSDKDGANIVLAKSTGDVSQKFSIICDKDGSYAVLTAASGGKSAVDVYEMSKDDGANVCQWDYWKGEGQKWILIPSEAEADPDPEPEKPVIGDVNADGKFDTADAVMLQKWLVYGETLTDWKAGDLCADELINVFDLCIMKKILKNQT